MTDYRLGDALREAGIMPVSPWEFLARRAPQVRITYEIAQALSEQTGTTIQFWYNMQEAFDNNNRAITYKDAIEKMEKHIKREPDGTFTLTVADGQDAGIDDPIVFADLKRSLEETNRKIRNGDLKADQIGVAVEWQIPTK